MTGTDNRWLHRFAVLLAICTQILIFVGGLVTSTESGLAVPDWPLAYGMVFPPMVGGILYEHGHRLAAAAVGFLTVILAVWLWRREPRRWMKNLGGLALLAVIGQGLLGGLTVIFLLPTAISVSHAGLAQLFFCLTVSLALFTSRSWQEERPRIEEPPGVSLKTLAAVTAAAVYVQTILGAIMRHTASGLAIPDWPLSFGRLVPPEFSNRILFNFMHRTWALVAAGLIITVAARVLRNYRSEKTLARPAMVLLAALAAQISLGALTVWSAKAVLPTTLHVACGAFTLAASVYLALRANRVLIPRISGHPVPIAAPGAAAR